MVWYDDIFVKVIALFFEEPQRLLDDSPTFRSAQNTEAVARIQEGLCSL